MIRVVREHSAIAAAIAAHDPARAALKMSAHLDALMADIPDIRRSNPNFFVDEYRLEVNRVASTRSKSKRKPQGGQKKMESYRSSHLR
jgi:hypothetical protein